MLGDLGGGKVRAMRGRNHETGPEGPWEEGKQNEKKQKRKRRGHRSTPEAVLPLTLAPQRQCYH